PLFWLDDPEIVLPGQGSAVLELVFHREAQPRPREILADLAVEENDGLVRRRNVRSLRIVGRLRGWILLHRTVRLRCILQCRTARRAVPYADRDQDKKSQSQGTEYGNESDGRPTRLAFPRGPLPRARPLFFKIVLVAAYARRRRAQQ